MKTTSYQVADSLWLVSMAEESSAPPPPAPAVNHIAVIDCSGSMWGDLPKIREQLKRRIPKLLRKGDSLSVIWFSGKGQFGALLEGEAVANLVELQEVNSAIDRYLQPVGLTGFKEPLEEVTRLVERVGKKNGNPFALFFMSDGWDNQWPKQDIVAAVEKASATLASATFVEYGNYADRALLTKMAEKAGGSLIQSETFDRYAPAFEMALTKRATAAKRLPVMVKGDAIGGFAFALSPDGDLLTFEVDQSKVAVSRGELGSGVWYLSPTCIGKASPMPPGWSAPQAAAYAAVALFAVRMQPNVVWPLLKHLGDVAFIDDFANCFGKQAYANFAASTRAAAFVPAMRLTAGHDPARVPADDAFCLLDFLTVLDADEQNRVLIDSPDFVYHRIGRPALPVEVLDAKGKPLPPLVFTPDEVQATDGYAVSTLTYNEERPNVSILIRKEGTVDLSRRLRGSGFEKIVPPTFRSFIHRNYAIVKDGIVNVDRLPVRMTANTVRELVKRGMPMSAVKGQGGEADEKAAARIKKASGDRSVSFVVDLRNLPVLNRLSARPQSAHALAMLVWELTRARAMQKVLNDVKKEKFPRKSEGFEIVYGKEAAEWLKELGLTDYSGFSPKSKLAGPQDQYVGKTLEVSLQGLNSLPSVKDAKKALAAGKVTPRVELLRPALEMVESFEKSPVYVQAKDKDKVYRGWLDSEAVAAKTEVRRLLRRVSEVGFSVIVGQTWFEEWKTLDENAFDFSVGGQPLRGSIEMKEVLVDI